VLKTTNYQGYSMLKMPDCLACRIATDCKFGAMHVKGECLYHPTGIQFAIVTQLVRIENGVIVDRK